MEAYKPRMVPGNLLLSARNRTLGSQGVHLEDYNPSRLTIVSRHQNLGGSGRTDNDTRDWVPSVRNSSFRLRLAAVLVVSAVTLVAPLARADVLEKTTKVGGVTVHYKVVLPNDYDPSKAYPGIIALGGGPQTMNTVDGTLSRNFRAEAEKRGYIVVAPAAPDGQLFFENGARIFPAFLKVILGDYKIQDGKFHIAGPSNGGIAAFHVAAANPQYFTSITAFPGYMWESTPAKLQAIAKMCVFMYVGESDEYRWHDEMKREAEVLRAQGAVARYTVEKGQPHRLETLAGVNASRLFDGFEETKKGCSK